MNYQWHWGIFLQPGADGSVTYAHMLAYGLYQTVLVAGLGWIIALVLGVPIGLARFRGGVLGSFARAYVELFRNVPLLVQMFLWYFVFPELCPSGLKAFLKQSPYSAVILATISLGTYTAFRIAELVRTGLNSVPKGQRSASAALGLSEFEMYRSVLLPQAIRIVFPTLATESISVVKNSAIALTIGVMELTSRARAMQEYSFQIFEAFTVATALYLILNVTVIMIMHGIEKHIETPK